MISLFHDPIAGVLDACNEMFPGIDDIKIEFAVMSTRGKNRMYGATEFDAEGNLLAVTINARCPLFAVPEIIAHEIAHVVVHQMPERDKSEDDHGPTWDAVFGAILRTYTENMMAFAEQHECSILDPSTGSKADAYVFDTPPVPLEP